MVIVFGSVNVDLIFRLPELPRSGQTVLGRDLRVEPGGKGANQALAAARDGAAVAFAGAVGQDAMADDGLALLRQGGVDLSRVRRVPGATGCAAICVDPAGHNQIAVASAANLHATQGQVEDALLAPGATVLLQMETDPAETAALIGRARGRGAQVVLNLAPAGKLPRAALAAVDVLVLNEEEAAWLAADLGTADNAAALHAALGVAVVTTLGHRGLAGCDATGSFAVAGLAIEVVDTTAAGDCLTGVLAAGLDRGLALRDALVRANAAAALCCTRPGSQGSLPTAAETNAFLATSPALT